MEAIMLFVQKNKLLFDFAQALSTLISLVVWTFGGLLIWRAWRSNAIRSISVGPIEVAVQEAVVATAAAQRSWQPSEGKKRIDMGRVRSMVSKAFIPEVAESMTGKSVLWVDDNPRNNDLAVRALRKLQLVVEQETSTEAGLARLKERHFDLVISDMGRGTNMQAGYELLAAVRASGSKVPFFIFAGSDRPEFRKAAAERGAQLSTNDMLELVDAVIATLGR